MYGLKHGLLIYGLSAVFALIFAALMALQDVAPGSVIYGLSLCAVIAAIVFAVNLLLTRQRHGQVQAAIYQLPYYIDGMPKPRDIIEADYQQMVTVLYEAYRAQADAMEAAQVEMMDYYTLWLHQIKTPIAATRLLLQSESHPLNREIIGELFKIEQYTEMALQYVRLGSDSSDFVFQRYDLDAIITRAVRKYAPLFIRSKITLDYTPLGCKVLTDEKWLQFVIEQLLSNALKYTPAGKVSITLAGEATLVIADTGIGIAPEDLPRIFDKGFTGHNGRQEQKSTGIGLYLCRRILESLRHPVSVVSVPGKGTQVSIDLACRKTLYE